MTDYRVADTHTTRMPVAAPVTFGEFLRLLYRGIDEGPVAARTGERVPAWVANRGQR